MLPNYQIQEDMGITNSKFKVNLMRIFRGYHIEVFPTSPPLSVTSARLGDSLAAPLLVVVLLAAAAASQDVAAGAVARVSRGTEHGGLGTGTGRPVFVTSSS